MPASLIALQIFLILLPGFASAYVVQFLVTRRRQTDFERVIEALLHSFAIYVIYFLLRRGRLPFHVVPDPIGGQNTILWESRAIALLAVVTFTFAMLVAAYFKHDGNRIFRLLDIENGKIPRWLRWLKLTERTTRNSIWNDILESEYKEGQFVLVELRDGRHLIGVILYYSDNSDEAALYLTHAAWVIDSKPVSIQEGGADEGGILLTKSSGIQSITLLRSSPKQAESTLPPHSAPDSH